MAEDSMTPEEAEKRWIVEWQKFLHIAGEVYSGNFDIHECAKEAEKLKKLSLELAKAAANAGNSDIARKIEWHFKGQIRHYILGFEGLLDSVEEIEKLQERRRETDSDVVYKFDTYMIEGHLGDLARIIDREVGLFHILRFDFIRDNLLNSEIAARFGMINLPPLTGSHRYMEGRLYDIVSECSREFDARGVNDDGTPWSDEQKYEQDRKETAKASLVARRMSCGPEMAMEMFIAFGAQSLALIANRKQPVANLPKLLIDYATYAFAQPDVAHGKTLAKALGHDFGFNGKESIAASSLCHNHTVIYLRQGYNLKTAQSKARDDLTLLESI